MMHPDTLMNLAGLVYCHYVLYVEQRWEGKFKEAKIHLAKAIVYKEQEVELKPDATAEDYCILGQLRLQFTFLKLRMSKRQREDK